MSDYSSPQHASKDGYPKDTKKVALGEPADSIHNLSVGEGVDILGQQSIDPALNAKMHIVNNVSAWKAVLVDTRQQSGVDWDFGLF
jgi:hypothetical protein